jgi:hypothetical protein
MPAKNLVYINIGVTVEQRRMLQQIAQVTGHTQSTIVRMAIAAYHADRVCNRPTCASGGPCLMPQMRPQFPQNPAQPDLIPQTAKSEALR